MWLSVLRSEEELTPAAGEHLALPLVEPSLARGRELSEA